MFTFCQRLVLMFECETFCALILRLPVMSLLAMARSLGGAEGLMTRRQPETGRVTYGKQPLCQALLACSAHLRIRSAAHAPENARQIGAPGAHPVEARGLRE